MYLYLDKEYYNLMIDKVNHIKNEWQSFDFIALI